MSCTSRVCNSGRCLERLLSLVACAAVAACSNAAFGQASKVDLPPAAPVAVECPPADCPLAASDDPALGLNPITHVIVLLDATLSMLQPCVHQGEQRLAIALWGAYDMIDATPDDTPLAVVRLRDDAEPLRPLEGINAEQKSLLRRGLMSTKAMGQTELKVGIEHTRRLLEATPDASPLIVLLTDGFDCHPGNAHGAVAELRRDFGDRLRFEVVAISADPTVVEVLRSLADSGGGGFTAVRSSGELPTAMAGAKRRCDDVRLQRVALAKKSQDDWQACCESYQAQSQTVCELQAELDACRRELAVTRQDLAAAKDRTRQLEAELTEAKTRIKELEAELTAARTKAADLEKRCRTLWRRFWGTVALLTGLALLLLWWAWLLKLLKDSLTTERDRLLSEKRDLKGRIVDLEHDVDGLRADLKAARHCEVQLRACQQAQAECQKELQRLQGTLQCLSAEKARLQCELDCCRQQLSKCNDSSKDCQRELRSCEQSLAEKRAQYEGVLRELERKKDSPIIITHHTPQAPVGGSSTSSSAGGGGSAAGGGGSSAGGGGSSAGGGGGSSSSGGGGGGSSAGGGSSSGGASSSCGTASAEGGSAVAGPVCCASANGGDAKAEHHRHGCSGHEPDRDDASCGGKVLGTSIGSPAHGVLDTQ